MMGMLCLVVMVGSDWRYGVISGLIGFALGTVGIDLETGQSRFTFGSAEMIGGIDFIPVAIGLFGLGELFYAFYEGRHASGSGGIVQYQRERRFWPEMRDWIETRVTMVRASLLGFAIGVIPGAGATIASLLAYSVE
jgi:putative tricarboxylic transport membrane protein